MSANDEVRQRMLSTGIHTIILWIEENVTSLPNLSDMSDADMALMYLRHIEKDLNK